MSSQEPIKKGMIIIKEIFYPNCEFSIKYYIDTDGNVWSGKYKRPIVQIHDKDGYVRVTLMVKDGNKTKKKLCPVHRLVLCTFNPCDNMMNLQVNHIDGNKDNNNVSNLEWCTTQENIDHAFRIGLRKQIGQDNPSHKLTNNDILEIRQFRKKNLTEKQIGNIYGVCEETIGRIIRGRTWSHIF